VVVKVIGTSSRGDLRLCFSASAVGSCSNLSMRSKSAGVPQAHHNSSSAFTIVVPRPALLNGNKGRNKSSVLDDDQGAGAMALQM
jgi:hypothetical protein